MTKGLLKKIKTYLNQEEEKNGFDDTYDKWTTIGYANKLLMDVLVEIKEEKHIKNSIIYY